MAKKITLQTRITTLMVIFTILFITAFTAIQLKNQLKNVTNHNLYRARLGSIIVKNALEKVLSTLATDTNFAESLQTSLHTLSESKLIDDAYITDLTGKIVSSTQQQLIDKIVPADDLQMAQAALKAIAEHKSFSSFVQRKQIDIFMPLVAGGNYSLIAKVSFSLGNIKDALRGVYTPFIFTAFVVIVANILLGMALSQTIIGPIRVLNSATKDIASGNLELRVTVRTNDELEELSDTFNEMTVALARMKERAENANPLTKLPGNTVIREEIEKRIQEGTKFVVVHSDLDNFKAFNDKYGLAKGDEAIKLTAQVIRESLLATGNPADFVGHEGGDDFVFITAPDKAEAVTSWIITHFENRVRQLYNKEDLNKGFIEEKDRHGELRKFPIMTISMAGVSNELRQIKSYAEFTNIAAEMKKKVKSVQKSVFMVDKRTD